MVFCPTEYFSSNQLCLGGKLYRQSSIATKKGKGLDTARGVPLYAVRSPTIEISLIT